MLSFSNGGGVGVGGAKAPPGLRETQGLASGSTSRKLVEAVGD